MILNNLNIILILTPILVTISIWCYFYFVKATKENRTKLRELELVLSYENQLKKTLSLKEKENQDLEKKTNKLITNLKIDIFNLSFSLKEILIYTISTIK